MIKAGALLAVALVLAGPAARAQTYPSRQITLIIPFTPGGSNDLVGRAIGKKLSEAWGQPVVVENRGGGGTLIGSAAVAKAPPDGYTLLLVSPTFTINPATRKTMPFDTARDFTPIAFIARAPLLVTTSNKLPVQSAGELFALAKSKPGQITYASAGLGSINQISTELIALAAGVKLAHVPYKGGAPALNDLAGGHVDIYVSSIPQALPARPKRPDQGSCGDEQPANGAVARRAHACGVRDTGRRCGNVVGHRRPGRDACGCRSCAERGDQQDPDIARARHVSHQ